MLKIEPTAIPDVVVVVPRRFHDDRGFFVETWNRARLAGHGFAPDFVQDNLSLSIPEGTVRGLHFQRPPTAQAKLVSVIQGAILDVVVDLRQGSPWYGASVALELSAENGKALLVPRGFAHGFCTLVPDTVVTYKVDNPYSAADDDGLFWADPALGISWPVAPEAAKLSDKDRRLPPLAAVSRCFTYEAGGAWRR